MRHIVKKSFSLLATTSLCVSLLVGAMASTARAAAPVYLSPTAIAPSADGKALYVACKSAKKVLTCDPATGKVLSSFSVPKIATGIAVAKAGLIVTAGEGDGAIYLATPDGKSCTLLAKAHMPLSPFVHPKNPNQVYVCDRGRDVILLVDIAAKKIVGKIPAVREPVDVVVTPDGATVLIANHLPTGRADGDYNSAVITVADAATNKVRKQVTIANGAMALREVILTKDGKYAYFTHILARYQLPTTQLARGWVSTNAVTIFDVAKDEIYNTVLLDDVNLGASNPWAIALTDDQKSLVVTQAGSQDISVIDTAKLNEALAKALKDGKAKNVPNDLSFLAGIKKRIALEGNGPRSITIIGSKAYIPEFFTDSMAIVDLAATPIHVTDVPLGPKLKMTKIRKGKMYFNDAGLCFQKWLACATCHPDTRSDGLNWDLMNDGMGTPKQSRSMLHSHLTPPVMVTGIRPDAETAVRAGLKHIQFAQRPEEDAVCIDEYLKSLEPIASPHLIDGKPSAEAVRGKVVFKKAGCSSCHPAPLYTDKEKHDVGTGLGREKGIELDTPGLVELWRTHPYLYQGQAATLMDLLTTCNKDDMHGTTSGLSKKELADLVAYLETL